MMKMIKKGIYIHIPFCDKKCSYCDFTTIIGKDKENYKKYLCLLLQEIDLYKDPSVFVDTIYIGGGTPSLFPWEFIERILCKLNESFSILNNAEITLECNPNTIDYNTIKKYTEVGINRISLGVQCFQNHHLKKLGRMYTREKIIEDCRIIRQGGIKNLSIDLIYGFPKQKKEDILEDLEFIDQIQPEHISWYNLIVEDKTLFGYLYQKGELTLPSDEDEEAFYLLICQELKKRQYKQYELSNFSKPGYASMHNLKYWHNEEYFGFGIGVSGYIEKTRYKNYINMKEYAVSIEKREYPYLEVEELNRETFKFEYIIMHMRLDSGLSLGRFEELFGVDLYLINKTIISEFIESGHLQLQKDRISFTQKGFFISNYFLSKIDF